MKKINLKVPDINYMSEWSDLDVSLPPGKIIVNKVVCGCGMTNYYLTNNLPVILVSPRRELIISKTKDCRTFMSYYFNRQDKNISVEQSKSSLRAYLHQPQDMPYGAPKVMCTYDSLHHVIDVLNELNCLDKFTIVGDEATCIFTDARLKGPKSLDLLYLIDKLPNRCVFITATPLNDIYLDEVPIFNSMPYVTLEWPQDKLMTVTLKRQKMISTVDAVSNIIDTFHEFGYFQSKNINGQEIKSMEAVFFLNSVKDILKIAKRKGLTKKDTRIICADDNDNVRDLKKVGLEIGHFPSENEYRATNKTFTFVTKCSFEGADLYSDCASIYIFADANRENLNLDISIDLPQIIGRCRTKSNPFRHEIRYFYKTTDSEKFDLDVAKQELQLKIDKTNNIVNKMNGCLDDDIVEKFIDAQKSQQYSKDYVDVISDGNGRYMFQSNTLVILSDLRALEIKHQQYKSNYSVLCYLNNNGYNAINYYAMGNCKEAQFLQMFDNAGSFEDKMKVFVDGCADEDIRNWAMANLDIPQKFKKYYCQLGAVKCRALSYKEDAMENELKYINDKDKIRQRLSELLKPQMPYPKKQIKKVIQSVYNELRLDKTATAAQLSEYFDNIQEGKVTNTDGKRINCLKYDV